MGSALRTVDGLAVAYLLGSALVLVPGCARGWAYIVFLGLHVTAAVGILLLRQAESLPPVLCRVRELYPLVLLLLLYGEVDLLVRVVHDSPGFDVLVSQWDLWLFGMHPHASLSDWLSGRVWRELFHLVYLSYYLFLTGAFLGVRWLRPKAFPRFSFVVTGMFVSFVAVFVVFPVAGPLSSSGASLMTAGLFPGIVARVYAPLAVDGIHSGAFPSSHVGMSVGVALLIAPRQWWLRGVLTVLVLAIAVSTVYGHFHYAVDAVAGLVAGVGLFLVWNQLYRFLKSDSRPTTGAGQKEHLEAVSAAAPEEEVKGKVR